VYDQLDANAMGPGWSWGDYDAYYAPERSEIPLYGNVIMAGTTAEDSLWISPEGFDHQWQQQRPEFARDQYSNRFYLFAEEQGDTLEIPYITDTAATRMLLESYLGKKIDLVNTAPKQAWETIYGVPADSVYKRMMKNSDNFLAEQLLIQASGMIGDTLDPGRAIRFILEGPLAHLKHQPRWVDGSGLSRYNLFTPESMVATLTQLYECYGTERLFAFFPEGGVSGTLKGYFPDIDNTPYVHAKTGTLSNNYNLSGYLVTRSGKLLIFSFMNNHYRTSSTAVKQRMAPILEWIRDHY
jgi:D-alanyl-D-alanine carboxypeptidase/D-alanyl-D-alanine-endopeptidase (penicillin-binding protein 4)